MATNHKTYLLDFMADMRPFSEAEGQSTPIEFKEVVALVETEPMNAVIIELFEHAGLDYRDAGAWLKVVGLFAEQLLWKRPGGKPKKWVRPTAATVRRDLMACVRRNSSRSGALLVEMMKKDHPKKYAAPVGTILRWFVDYEISLKEVKKLVKNKPHSKFKKNGVRSFA
jgi:hypothetical protein